MTFCRLIAGSVILAASCTQVLSGTMAGIGVRDPFAEDTVYTWSVGASLEWMKRQMEDTHGGGEADVMARTASFFIGHDVCKWASAFATIGTTQVKMFEDEDYGDKNLKCSLGLQANLWKTEIMDPEFMSGTLTFRPYIEVGRFQIEEDLAGFSGRWVEYSAIFPFYYEMFTDKEESVWSVPYSLALSFGPMISVIEGWLEYGDDGSRGDFKAKKSFGLAGSLDIYFAHNVSVGCQVEYVDHMTVAANVMFHF